MKLDLSEVEVEDPKLLEQVAAFDEKKRGYNTVVTLTPAGTIHVRFTALEKDILKDAEKAKKAEEDRVAAEKKAEEQAAKEEKKK